MIVDVRYKQCKPGSAARGGHGRRSGRPAGEPDHCCGKLSKESLTRRGFRWTNSPLFWDPDTGRVETVSDDLIHQAEGGVIQTLTPGGRNAAILGAPDSRVISFRRTVAGIVSNHLAP